MKTGIIALIGPLALLLAASSVDAKSVTVRLDAQSITSGTSDRGPYYVVSLSVPEELAGKRLDAVLLEFYVDVAPDASLDPEYTPSIDVYPLTAAAQPNRTPVFSRNYPSSFPVALGESRRVSVDITGIVKEWIASPSANYGLVIGSFGGPKISDLDVRNDVLGSGQSLQVTFFYQNRFGGRVSQ